MRGSRSERGDAGLKFLVLLGALGAIGAGTYLALGRRLVEEGGAGGPIVRRQAFVAQVKGFDPALAGDLYSGTAAFQIYEPLYEFHYLERPFREIPLTAEAMPEISQDRLTYRIRLKKGIRFHDDSCFPGGTGRELTVHDYIYAWKRVADPRVQSELWAFFQGKIVGLDALHDRASTSGNFDYDAPVEGLQAPDPHTLVVKLTRPSVDFVYLLVMPFTAAVPREAVEHYKDDFINHGVGTGAYRLVEWVPNSRIVYEKNPDYHDVRYPETGAPGDRESGLLADAGKRVPFSDRVEITIITEDQPRWLQFERGALDIAGVPKDAHGKAIVNEQPAPYLREKGVQIEIVPELDVTYICFNMVDPVIGKNRLLRRAIAHAADLEKTREIFFNGRGLYAQSPIPPGLFGYDPNYRNPHQEYNLDKARKHLADAGYPGGEGLPEIVYDSSGTDTTSRQMAEHFQENMSKIGIKIRIEANTWPAFSEKINKRQCQAWGIAWGADYPDPENFLQLFYGPSSSPNGQNGSNYQNPEYDKLYEEIRVLPDGPDRLRKIHRMRDIIAEDNVWVYELHRVTYILKNPWIRNYKYPPFLGGAFYKYTKADMAERKKWIGE
ncbi:MAG: ABC transporter substrate-binding protein [Planctomycetales bacterium]|nr:ABC transporter substrate-binding protein [Planctomycetales bacterium]